MSVEKINWMDREGCLNAVASPSYVATHSMLLVQCMSEPRAIYDQITTGDFSKWSGCASRCDSRSFLVRNVVAAYEAPRSFRRIRFVLHEFLDGGIFWKCVPVNASKVSDRTSIDLRMGQASDIGIKRKSFPYRTEPSPRSAALVVAVASQHWS
jgi:hypothetical protein